MLSSEAALTKLGLKPLARLVDYSVTGVDPTIMGIGPAYAIHSLLKKNNMSLADIELVEVSVPMCDILMFRLHAHVQCNLVTCRCKMLNVKQQPKKKIDQ